MTKADLTARIHGLTGLSRAQAEAALNALLDAVANELKAGNDMPLPGFGKFVALERSERVGRNPRTGKSITIPACKVVGFRVAKRLRELLAQR